MIQNNPLESLNREPKILRVIRFPDPILSKPSTLITSSIPDDEGLQELLSDMVHTMQAYKAAGLAAVQVGVNIRALVVQGTDGPVKVINPVIKEVDGLKLTHEGCLSFPGLFLRVSRPDEVVVQYFDETGTMRTTVMGDLLGRAIQHEIDHLDGKTFLDRVGNVNRASALAKYKAVKRKMRSVLAQMD